MNRYDEYKETGIEWLGKIPNNWALSRVGKFFKERSEKVDDNTYPPLSVTMSGIVDQLSNVAKTNDGDNRKLVKKGDFVINSRSDRKGSSGIAPRDGSVSLINIVLEPHGLHSHFIQYLFKSHYFKEEYFRNGKGIHWDLWTTRWDQLKNINIPIPKIQEQKLISRYLDKKTEQIDKLIKITQKKIELLKEKQVSLINQFITKGIDPDVEMKDSGVKWIGNIPKHWHIKKVKHLTLRNGFRSGPFGSTLITNELSDFGDWIVYSPENLKLTNIANQLFVPEYRKLELEKYLVKTNDILIPIVGSLNISMLITKDHPKGILNQRLCRLSLDNSKINVPFFSYMFINSQLIKIQINLEKKGSILDHITKEIIFNLLIPCAPRDEQDKIFDRLKSVKKKYDLVVEKYLLKIKLLKEYRKLLIYSTVTGKFCVTKELM